MQNIVTFTPRTGVSDVRRGDRGPATILILPSVRIYAVTPHRVQSAKTEAALGILQRCFAAET